MWRRLVAAVLALPALHADDGLPLAKESVCGTGGRDCPRCQASFSKWSHCILDAEHSFTGGTTVFLKSEDCPVGMAVFVSSTLPQYYDSLKLADALMKTPVWYVFRVFLPNSACSLCIEHDDLPDAKVHVELRQSANCIVQDWMTGQCACAGAVTRGRLLGLLFSYVHDVLLMIGLNFHVPDPTPANLLLICNPEGSTSFQPPRIQWADFLATSSGESTRGLLAGSDREIAEKVKVFFGSIMFAAQHPDLASVQQIADLCVDRLELGLKPGVTLCMERVWSEQQKMNNEELHDFRRFVAGEIFFNEIDALSARITDNELELADVKRKLADVNRELAEVKTGGTTSTSVVWVRELARNKDGTVTAKSRQEEPAGEEELEPAFQVSPKAVFAALCEVELATDRMSAGPPRLEIE